MAQRTLVVYPTKDAVAQAGAQRLLLAIADMLGERLDGYKTRNRVDVALTGGSDTIKALEYMASNPLTDTIDWARVHLWWADERFVAANDNDRNALQARRMLLDRLVADGRLPESNIHEMAADTRNAADIAAADDATTDALLDKAARAYERELTRELGAVPVMDIAVMGMGPDGHYASLFPGHAEVSIADRLVVGVNHSPKMPPLRLSMTAPLLAQTRRMWFLTAGAGKADALAHVFATRNDPAWPSSFADATDELVWFTTPDAAAQL